MSMLAASHIPLLCTGFHSLHSLGSYLIQLACVSGLNVSCVSGSGRSGRNPSKCHNSGRSSYPEGVGRVQSYTHCHGNNKSPCQHSAINLHEYICTLGETFFQVAWSLLSEFATNTQIQIICLIGAEIYILKRVF